MKLFKAATDNKKTNSIRNYIYINITCLFLSIYVIFYPFFSKLLGLISPILLQCPYKVLTGHYCPLCGGTRYIQNISQAFYDITYLFNIFGVIIICTIFELFFRIFILIRINKIKNVKNVMTFDIIWHSILALLLFAYEMQYIIINAVA